MDIFAVTSEKISVPAGDEFAIDVPVLGAAGYTVSVEADKGVLETLSSKMLGVAKEAVGGEGTERICLRALAPGSYEIRIIVKRAWEQSPLRTYSIELQVKD